MLLEYVEKLDEKSILSDDVFIELFKIDDYITRLHKVDELENRASQLKVLARFKRLYRAHEQKRKNYKNSFNNPEMSFDIEIPEKEINYISGRWQTDEIGIYIMTEKGKEYACYHPIVPIGILKNAESGVCKTMLLFRVRDCWSQINVDRVMLASATGIVKLAQYGVQVTSENARLLVRYLNDIEALNPDTITDHLSTSKLGWIGDQFMPYATSEIIFDNDPKLMSLFESVHEHGSREKWYAESREIRAAGHTEINLYMIASLASVLVKICGALPFIVSLWGGTGKGKTVSLMWATSVWANPNEGAYISDAKATTTAMEIRLDALNNLPLCIDDMAQIKAQDEDFSQIIYRWCAGKGRDRSNQALGLNPLTTWSNCTLTNGERSLITNLMQGGAANRVIDIELTENMFKDGNKTTKKIKANYGFCGKEFVSIIQDIGFPEVNKRFEEWVDRLKKLAAEMKSEKEDKQIIPMALIMLADEISEKHLFKDGVRLDPVKCLGFLKDKEEINENRRAYEYIKNVVVANSARFEPEEDGYRGEIWGIWVSNTELAFIPSVFERIMAEAGFQNKSFLSWASRNGLVVKGEGNNLKKKVRICGHPLRCVVLIIDDNADFIEVSDDMADDIPFK